jgi:putative membrane protein
MLPAPRLVVAPEPSLVLLAWTLAGAALGTASGLTPGLHANNFALLLAAVAPSLPGPPLAVGCGMLAAGTVHTFLDVVPALALGVPDAAMAAGALPGHELVLAGRGREALRLSALGSGLAVVVAVPLAVPVTEAMVLAYPTIRAHLPLVLGLVVAFLVGTESSVRGAVAGAVAFGASASLGVALLDAPAPGVLPVGGTIAPLFAGLFGAPVLLDAMRGAGVPPQGDARVTMPRRDLGVTALAGGVSGALVGYLPGVSAGVAAVLALPAVPGRSGTRGYVVASSGANTGTAVFALFALVALGSPRTGVLVAVADSGVPLVLPVLLSATAVAAAVGFALVAPLGDWYLRAAGGIDPKRLSLAILALLLVIAWLVAGVVGLGAFLAATAVGLLPPRLGTRRIHLMGVLIGPLLLG